MIQMYLLNIQTLWIMQTIILMITTQREKDVLIASYMIADIMTNEKFQAYLLDVGN